MNPSDSLAGKLTILVLELAIGASWVWMAVWTTRGLRTVTRNTIPFPKRTVWLTKILAVIVGAGTALAAFLELGLPWYLAIVPAGVIVFFAFGEKVEDIAVSKPPQDEAVFRASWKEYRRVRTKVVRSCIGFVLAIAGLILVASFRTSLPETTQRIVLVALALIFAGSLLSQYYFHWKMLRWPCPRCGCSFRGLWGFPWLPKRCRYCGLPRWEENPRRDERSPS